MVWTRETDMTYRAWFVVTANHYGDTGTAIVWACSQADAFSQAQGDATDLHLVSAQPI